MDSNAKLNLDHGWNDDQLRRLNVQVIRKINRGGFGFVDEVKTSSGINVARKTFDPNRLDPSDMPSFIRRFKREVRIQAAIKHPNLMPVLDTGLDDDPPWFTMPLASTSLELKIQDDHKGDGFDQRPWPDILAAVEELHRLGYVHRDLKPANILFVEGKWVVSDFGLILPTMRDTTVLTRSSAYGSHNYAAPEQALDFKNTPEQADIYALGCMLHDAPDVAHSSTPYAQIKGVGVYGSLLEKCTEVDYKKRFPTIAIFRAALFDLWSAAPIPSVTTADKDVFSQVLNTPESPDSWRGYIQYVEQQEGEKREALLRPINSDLLLKLQAVDEMLFSRMIRLICAWTKGSSFEWKYCDVMGDRLLASYGVASTRLRCEIILATLELAVSHNRWHVMNQVGKMLGRTTDNGLVDRILIEVGAYSTAN